MSRGIHALFARACIVLLFIGGLATQFAGKADAQIGSRPFEV